MKRLVVDTGPILHLHEAGALHLLPNAGEIILPSLVAAELRSIVPSLPPQSASVHSLSAPAQYRAQQWLRAGLMHGGEAEALSLALDLKADWFLTDDAAARLMAESLHVEAHGSIGMILWLAAQKLTTEKESRDLFRNLEKSSLWMSPKVRAEARTALDILFS